MRVPEEVAATPEQCPAAGPHGACPGPPDLATGLIHLTEAVRTIYTRVADRHDLTPVQARLLSFLLTGPRGMAELASCFGVERAALTGLMDRAERIGLAHRAAVPGDRRAVQVLLTDHGRATATAFQAEVTTELTRLTATLTPAEQDQFGRTMTAILQSCHPPTGRPH